MSSLISLINRSVKHLYYIFTISDRPSGPLRNDPPRPAAHWKQKCCRTDQTRPPPPSGAMRQDDKDCLLRHTHWPSHQTNRPTPNAKTWSTRNSSNNILNYEVKQKSLTWKNLKLFLADWRKLKCQEKVLQNLGEPTTKPSHHWKPLKNRKLKKITRRLKDFIPDQL